MKYMKYLGPCHTCCTSDNMGRVYRKDIVLITSRIQHKFIIKISKWIQACDILDVVG